MRTDRRDVRSDACISNDSAYGVSVHRTLRRMASQEQCATRNSRASVRQIRYECLANIDRERQTVDPVPLPSDDDLSGPPINATQFQISDLGCP